jgi:hypothetical protein
MKKIFAILALATAGAAFAGSATVEYQAWENPTTKADTTGLVLSVREDITKSLAGDVVLSVGQAESTKAFSGRSEVGLTYSVPFGRFTGSVRGATGLKHTSGSSDTSYYSVEPAVAYGLTDKLTARVGFRFRDAYDSGVADQTRTGRVGLSYALTKQDAIGVRYDRVRGDSELNIVAVNYTRRF